MPTVDQTYEHAVALDRLHPDPANPNIGDTDGIAESIRANGFYGAILAAKDGTIVAGEHRWRSANLEAEATVPVIWLNVDASTARRILLGDNEYAARARRDTVKLADLLRGIVDDEGGVDALVGTGYSEESLDRLLAEIAKDTEPQPDPEIPSPPPPTKVRTKRGDVWQLGDHLLMCGDCRDAGDVTRLIDGRLVNICVTSPPYAEQREYDSASEFHPISPDEYVEWFAPVSENIAAHLADDGSFFLNIKPSAEGLDTALYVMDLVVAHVRDWGWHFATEFCWERGGVPKHVTRRFKNQFEPVYQLTRGDWKIRPDAVRHWSDSAVAPLGPGAGDTNWRNTQGNGGQAGSTSFGPGEKKLRPHGGHSGMGGHHKMEDAQGTNWAPGETIGPGLAYPGNRLPTFAGTHDAVGHSAAFPVGLPAWFIRAYSDPGDLVYEPFAGSGSTILAAHNETRVAAAMEISPKYCDVICRRFQAATGITPSRNGRRVNFV